MLRRTAAEILIKSYRYSIIIFGCAVIAAVWFGVALQIRSDLAEHRNTIADEMNGQSTVIESHVVRTIKEMDRAMLIVRNYIEVEQSRNEGAVPWEHISLPAPEAISNAALEISIADLEGAVRVSNIKRSYAIQDLMERPHFLVHKTSRSDFLYFGAPVYRKIFSRWTIPITRPLAAGPEGFSGIIYGALDPDQFFAIHPAINTGGKGSISILGIDGTVHASHGAEPLKVAEKRSDLPLFERMYRVSYGTFLQEAADPADARFVAYRKIDGYPLVIALAKSADEMLAPHYSRRIDYLAFGAVVTLMVMLGTTGGWNYQRRLSRTAVELYASEAQAMRKGRELALTLDNVGQGILMVDEQGRIAFMNDLAKDLLGLPRTFAVEAVTFADLLALLKLSGELAGDGNDLDYATLTANEWDGTDSTRVDHRTRSDGTVLELRTSFLPEGGFVHTLTDVTQRRRDESRITHLAHHDPLTGLANWTLFRERLDAAVCGLEHGQPFCLMFLDVDNFKAINDTLGHAVGDEFLREISRRLRSTTREFDIVARLGGDEFAIILHHVDAAEKAEDMAERILHAARMPLLFDGYEVSTAVSIGIAMAPEDASSPAQMLKAADLALYQAKAAGRNTACFFDTKLTQELQTRRTLELELKAAIAQDQFKLLFQPFFALETGKISGFEALLRWEHPLRGLISPVQFIPIAEEAGLIYDIGKWVLMEAARQATSWPSSLRISVNLSPSQFKSHDIVSLVAAVLEESGLPGDRLELEITETVLLDDSPVLLAQLHGLRELGIHLALDDFGTGYSSLSYLRKYPFHRVKIDQTFVAEMTQDKGCAAIVESIIDLAGRLGMTTTAEGVESETQLKTLRKFGCTEAQGYLLGRPLPSDSAAELIEKQRLDEVA